MQPIARKRSPRDGLRLRDLVFVMRKNNIDTARVNIERLAKILHCHRGALNVPARTSITERTWPERLVSPARLPQHEVTSIVFVVFVDVDARSGAHSAEIVVR